MLSLRTHLSILRKANLQNILSPKGSKRYASSASTVQILNKYPIGLQIHGYTIEEVQPIPEFSLVAVKLKHLKTGSSHLHLHTETDKNNVFSIGFKTNAPNATGVPHILEHTTLCGSYTYPVRDPFFKMLNRSLANFMNAMTGHDYTFYPFATTNAKDFENLMDVYLSSTLEPLLSYEDFMQEGWRIEPTSLEDKSSPLAFKGVVYNEMKGQYSNSAYYYYIKFQESIYETLKNSGGDPRKITDLQYEDLIDFQSTNYHPSNSKTFTYGSMPLNNHLEKLNGWFGPFGKRSVNSKKQKQSIFTQGGGDESQKGSFSVECEGPFDTLNGKPIGEQYKSSITWYLGNPLDETKQYEIFKWKLLSSLLCDGHNAPFYQELIEKRFGDDFTSNSGLDNTTSLLSFTIGLDNLTKEKVDGLEDKIKEILTTRVIPDLQQHKDGPLHERVMAILHQIELNFKKHKPDFGLGLLNSIIPTWTNNLDPIKSLQVDYIINQFKEDYEREGLSIFLELIEKSMLNNDQKFVFTMKPNEKFELEFEEDEKKRLHEKTKELTSEDREVIYQRSLELSKKQSEEQDASILPTLTLSDIPRKGDFHPLSFSKTTDNSTNIQKRVVDANGLSYVSAKKDISYIPAKYIPFLPLFTSCLTNLAGTDVTPITELETKIQQLTGGISFSCQATTDPENILNTKLNFVLDGMSLTSNSGHVYGLWSEILNGTKFNADDDFVLEKLSTLIKNLGLNQLNTIADRGNVYASSFSNSLLTPTKYITDLKSGLGQIQFIKTLNENLAAKGKDYLVEEILPVLQEIQGLLVNGKQENGLNFEYSILGDKNSIEENEKLVNEFETRMQNGNSKEYPNTLSSLVASFQNKSKPLGVQTFINLPYQIGFASMARLGSPYLSKDGAALQVLSSLVSNKHLHSIIREANGAYGGGLNYDGLGGTLNYYSYRDPNPMKSVDSFKDVSNVIVDKIEKNWENGDLQEAKLAIFQSIDAPSNISSQGAANFLRGITDDMRQVRREWFLDVNKNDLVDVANKYLIDGKGSEIVSVIGKKEDTELQGEWDTKEL